MMGHTSIFSLESLHTYFKTKANETFPIHVLKVGDEGAAERRSIKSCFWKFLKYPGSALENSCAGVFLNEVSSLQLATLFLKERIWCFSLHYAFF